MQIKPNNLIIDITPWLEYNYDIKHQGQGIKFMGETKTVYLCHQCQHVFALPVRGDASLEQGVKCPRCGSSHAGEMPSWVPIGFNLNQGPAWEYECQHCRHLFKLPVPGSPSQERGIKCPVCGGGHIHRMTALGGEPLYCG